MVLFNYSTKELTAKIVYYGPGLCGKTTNLQYIHANLPGNIKGKMLSLATKTDRTLFFDFLPLDLGMIRGMKTRVQLYTVPGQVFYNETRKLVLKGADGIVFVADSQETMAGANVEAFKNLEENLKAHGLNLAEMPHVIQFNKRDLPRLSGIEEMNSAINRFNAPFYESVATSGIGVQDTLKAITKLVLLNLTQKYDSRTGKAAATAEMPKVAEPAAPAIEMPPAAPVPEGPGLPLSAAESGPGSIPEAGLPLSSPEPAPVEEPLPPSMTLPEPPDFGIAGDSPAERASFMDADQDSTPEFADSDIDDLVGEVGEREFASTAVEPEAGPAEPVFEPGEGTAEEDPQRFEVEAQPMDTTAELSIDRPEPPGEQPVVETPEEPSFPSGAGLEVDRHFDPSWRNEPEMPAVEESYDLGSDEAFDLPASEPEPLELSSEVEAMEPDEPLEVPEAAGETVRLTEVLEDGAPTPGPELDVVRLAAGGVTEIVLPVELENGTELKRFKLTLNLRLDHVE